MVYVVWCTLYILCSVLNVIFCSLCGVACMFHVVVCCIVCCVMCVVRSMLYVVYFKLRVVCCVSLVVFWFVYVACCVFVLCDV